MTPEEFTTLDRGHKNKAEPAYTMTFPQMLTSKVPVVDFQGRLVGGPDRKTDDPRQKWQSWQRAVQEGSKRPGFVPPEVMAYFQATKHLVRPPREGDMNIQQTGKLDKTLITVNPEVPRFTWSPSKLMDFECCPTMYAAKHFYKTVPYEETVHTIWGTRVHQAAEYYMTGVEIEDLEAFEVVAPYVRLLSNLPGERFVEHKMSLDDNWKPCAWEDGTGRMILDLGFKDGKSIKAYDWKTGKVKDDMVQMQIYAYVLAILNPEVEEFDFKYIWLKEKKTTGFKCSRKDLLPIAKDIRERIKRMKTACDEENFSMRKNGLCRNWCGHMGCPYNGRR